MYFKSRKFIVIIVLIFLIVKKNKFHGKLADKEVNLLCY